MIRLLHLSASGKIAEIIIIRSLCKGNGLVAAGSWSNCTKIFYMKSNKKYTKIEKLQKSVSYSRRRVNMPKPSDGKNRTLSKGDSDVSKSKDKLRKRIHASQVMRRAMRDTDNSDAHSATSLSSNRKISKTHSLDRSGHSLKPLLHLQNTFKTHPEHGGEYNEMEIRRVAEPVLDEILNGTKYDCQSAPTLTRTISNMVKDKVKMVHMPRYKFVVTAIIGEQGGQCLKAASRCVWNTATDSWTSVQYENDSLFAVVTVHGIYMD